MASLRQDVERLRAHLQGFEEQRASDGFVNDIYEAACYWRNLGNYVLEKNTMVNFPARAREELQLINELRKRLVQLPPQQQKRFAAIFDLGGQILKKVEKVQPPRQGHLRILRTIRQNFGFLQKDYGFSITSEEPTELRFSSGTVYLKLGWGTTPSLSCSFGLESSPRRHFWVDDLLYLYTDKRYRTIPQELKLDTEVDVKNWFEFLGGIWKQYGQDVLVNRSGVFDQLARAQAERNEEYNRELNDLYGKTS